MGMGKGIGREFGECMALGFFLSSFGYGMKEINRGLWEVGRKRPQVGW